MNFGDFLTAHLHAHDIPQTDVCDEMDRSPQFISQVAMGNKLPALTDLEPWADFLDISHARCAKLVLQGYLDRAGVKMTVTSVRKP